MSRIEEFFEKSVDAGIIPQIPMNYDAVSYKIYTGYLENKIDELTAEVAELRARLEKAGELPCEVGDTLYEPFINRIREWIVDSIYVFSLGTNVNCERKDDCRWHDHFAIRENSNDFESRVYLTREAAEARLKKLQGGER